jgi:methylated-DNA-[protein]-cysteine S-methyltransferase
MPTQTVYASPLGQLTLIGGDRGVRELRFPGRGTPSGEHLLQSEHLREGECLPAAVEQLEAYFAGERRSFELALELAGTPFQQRVWAALRRIAYGTTTTYGAIARELSAETPGQSAEPRAVGSAVARTPVPVVVPCHRVVGSDGSLTGYGGGLDRKRALLDFEASGGDPAVLRASWEQRQLALL